MTLIVLCCLWALSQSHRLCLYGSNRKDVWRRALQIPRNQFRSYHPHYLHSLSYPTPSTLHFYYGRVENNLPIMLIQQGFEGKEKESFVQNNRKKFLTTAYIPTLFGNTSKYIVVLAIEDSYEEGYTQNSTLSIKKGANIYSILLSNGTASKSFVLYFTGRNKTLPLTNVSVNARNISKDPKTNWMLSREVRWVSADQQMADLEGVTAMSLQIQVKTPHTNINFRQVKGVHSGDSQSMHQQIQFKHDRIYLRNTFTKPKETCASAAYNRLFEGLTYQYGELRIVNGSLKVSNPFLQLLSFSPSRKRFPWGFLWDDGFHNQVAARKDKTLALKVIQSWLSTMVDGWIPRQQNRGREREVLCNCQPYMNKDIRDGNPPSLMLPVEYLIRSRLVSPDEMRPLWDGLQKWYSWYIRTQMAGSESYLFKWFDHISSQGSFNSGMDDFPRPPGATYYVDTQSWMYFMSRTMQTVARFLGLPHQQYASNADKIKGKLVTFLQPYSSTFRDVTSNFLSSSFSPEVGYPSLLPLAFGMLEPGSKELLSTLDLITNTSMLNTTYGLSSIATSSRKYLQNKNAYWRGPVWINMNYLVLRGLKLHYPELWQVSQDLRREILKTVCGEWNRTGYFFENYVNGSGTFSFPFNGWTSLIAIIQQGNF